MAEPISPASKTRVLTHMNKDHQHDLSAILQHQLGISSSSPEMTNISLTSFTINNNGKSHTIPFNPPMASFSDVRPRLVEMTLSARTALGLGADGKPIRVTRFLPPKGRAAVVFSAVSFYFGCWIGVKAGLFEPGTVGWKVVERLWPAGGAEVFKWLVNRIILPVLGIHVVECWWLDRTRLRGKVDRGSGVWWAWVGCCFLEGFTCFKRFDGMIGEMVGKKE